MTSSPPGLDLAALEGYFRRELPTLLRGPLSARLFPGGRSNLTYEVTDEHHHWVLRRPPLGHVLETAHDMSREHKVMSALSVTGVPVPQMVTLCTDTAVLGSPFYMMSLVPGTVYRTEEQLAVLTPSDATGLADRLVDVLSSLHSVDPTAIGLAELGRPTGFLERQVARWGKQLAASHSRDVPGLTELGGRLASSVPDSARSVLVHGDYKLDNVVVDPDDGSVAAVLDWELATLGDPLTDLVNLVIWWDGVYGTDGIPFAAAPSHLHAFPPSAHLIERYARLTGADLIALAWYLGFACYKLAGIFEGIHYRETQGLTVGGGFEGVAGLAPALAVQGLEALRGAGP